MLSIGLVFQRIHKQRQSARAAAAGSDRCVGVRPHMKADVIGTEIDIPCCNYRLQCPLDYKQNVTSIDTQRPGRCYMKRSLMKPRVYYGSSNYVTTSRRFLAANATDFSILLTIFLSTDVCEKFCANAKLNTVHEIII